MTGGDDDVQSYEVDPQSDLGWVTATNPVRADDPFRHLLACFPPPPRGAGPLGLGA
jgi:hypothetical protein